MKRTRKRTSWKPVRKAKREVIAMVAQATTIPDVASVAATPQRLARAAELFLVEISYHGRLARTYLTNELGAGVLVERELDVLATKRAAVRVTPLLRGFPRVHRMHRKGIPF